jgi:hypothetical protein
MNSTETTAELTTLIPVKYSADGPESRLAATLPGSLHAAAQAAHRARRKLAAALAAGRVTRTTARHAVHIWVTRIRRRAPTRAEMLRMRPTVRGPGGRRPDEATGQGTPARSRGGP